MITPRIIATSFALVAFAGALFVGMRAGNPMLTILTRALLIMLGCYVVGRVVGVVADRTVQGQIATYKTRHPLGGNAEPDTADPASQAPARPERAAA